MSPLFRVVRQSRAEGVRATRCPLMHAHLLAHLHLSSTRIFQTRKYLLCLACARCVHRFDSGCVDCKWEQSRPAGRLSLLGRTALWP